MAQIDEGEGDEEIPDFDKQQTIAMMAERHRISMGNLKALEEARERIAELERQLERKDQRIILLETEAFWNAESRDTWYQKATEVKKERNEAQRRQEDAEAICADLLNMVREKGEGDRFWLEKYLTSAAERSDARQERDTLLETVAAQSAEIERLTHDRDQARAVSWRLENDLEGLKQLTGRRDWSEEGEGE